MIITTTLFIVLLIGYSQSFTTDLECYQTFDNKTHFCSFRDKRVEGYFDTPKECCDWQGAVAYSTKKSSVIQSDSVPCKPCSDIRDKVYCFSRIYYILARTCHEQQRDLTTIYDCCVQQKAEGFHTKLTVDNKTVPTYNCIPCLDAIVNASEWSPWSLCDASCNGGYRRRERKCSKIHATINTICLGEDTQLIACNEHSCEQEQLSPTMIVIILVALLLVVALLILLCICCVTKRKTPTVKVNSKITSAAAASPETSTVLNNEAFTDTNHPKLIVRYQRSPFVRRKLPTTPSTPSETPEPLEAFAKILKEKNELENSLTKNTKNPDLYIYSNIEQNYYNVEPNPYLSMDGKTNK